MGRAGPQPLAPVFGAYVEFGEKQILGLKTPQESKERSIREVSKIEARVSVADGPGEPLGAM